MFQTFEALEFAMIGIHGHDEIQSIIKSSCSSGMSIDFPYSMAGFQVDLSECLNLKVLPGIVQELMQKTQKLIFMCPITNESHTFVCPNDEDDTTHITRMTRDEWLRFFPFSAAPLDDLTRQVRGPEYYHGSVSVLLQHKRV